MPFKSSKQNRQAQRIKALNEVVGSGGATFTPIAYLPARMFQCATAATTLYKNNIKSSEKAILLTQSFIALAHIVALSSLIITQTDCKENKTDWCMVSIVIDLLYKGLLAGEMSLAELKREDSLQRSNGNDNPLGLSLNRTQSNSSSNLSI